MDIGLLQSQMRCEGVSFVSVPVTASTNADVKSLAQKGASEGLVYFADSQTLGRGRLGRSFFSPEESGLYMSILLRPNPDDFDVSKITCGAAVAAAHAIECTSDASPAIKWVNDILVDGKKVCGILAESATNQSGDIAFVVLGIGINLCPPLGGFPKEISGVAGAVFCAPQSDFVKAKLAAELLNEFFSLYRQNDTNDILTQYRKRCCVTGKDIWVISNGAKKEAHSLYIDDELRLVVRYSDGSVEPLSYGEMSVRPLT